MLGADHETDELFRRWGESERRSRERRSCRCRRPRRGRVPVKFTTALVAALGASLALLSSEVEDGRLPQGGGPPVVAASSEQPAEKTLGVARAQPRFPSATALQEAWSYARERGGTVSLAVVDSRGRLRARLGGRRYFAASVVKAMLLVAEVRRLERERLPLDPETERLLRAMITVSDNDAADSIYLRVGDRDLFQVARLAGMRRFTVAGHWGNAQVTAADMARLFSRLPRLLAGPHRQTALGLLGSVVSEQRWGLPRAAGRDWTVRFKGGWRASEHGQLVHQVARLRNAEHQLAITVLTDDQPSRLYAIHTVRGIADRLLDTSATAGSSAAPVASLNHAWNRR